MIVDRTRIVWGVKRSFRDYVMRVGGTLSVAAPATWTNDGFSFPLVSDHSDTSSGAIDLRFGGEALLQAYGGVLRVMIAEPGVTWQSGSGVLTIVDGAARGARVVIAALEHLPEPQTERAPSTVTLTAHLTDAGAALLGNVYASGTALDPIAIVGPTRSTAAALEPIHDEHEEHAR